MVRQRFDLDRPPTRTHPANDEFDAPTLNPKWTAVEGSPGDVDLVGTTGGIYDLTTRPGWLLMQPDTGDHIHLRQAYTLADGESVVAALAITLNASGESGITDSYIDCGISVTEADSAPIGGAWATVHFDSEVNGWRIFAGGATGYAVPVANRATVHVARQFYFRILRSGLNYYTYWSCEGATWFPFAAVALDNPAEYIWVFTEVVDNIPDPLPICGCNWVRIGGSGIDPW